MDPIAHRLCLVSLLTAILVIGGCVRPEVELKQDVLSPDGLHAASVYTSDSGATSSVLTIVNIRPARDSFKKREERGDVFAAFHAGQVHVEWRSAEELLIKVNGQPRIMLQVVNKWEIHISHEGLETKEPNQAPLPTLGLRPTSAHLLRSAKSKL